MQNNGRTKRKKTKKRIKRITFPWPLTRLNPRASIEDLKSTTMDTQGELEKEVFIYITA